MRSRVPVGALVALVAAAWAAAGGARAQGAWTVGRPEPLAEFASPLAPPPKPRPMAKPVGAPAPRAPAPAFAVQPTFADPGQSAALDQVVVVGHPPGPAMWRVRKGDAELVIIGGLSPLPHMLAWNEVRVKAALTGAKALLLPPRTSVNPLEALKLALRAGALRLPGSEPLQAKLPPDLRARFAQAVAVAHADPAHYAKWKPAVAGLLLIGDFRRAAGLSTAKPGTTIARLAKATGTPIRYMDKLSAAPVFDSLVGLPEPAQFACLRAEVDDVDKEAGHAVPAAQAWANGRLDQVRANWSTEALDRCLLPSARVQALLERGTADATRELERALSTPGRTVALVDLHFLLRSDGLLDRLKADGAQITTPG